jgi:hypothetical protein
MRRARKFANVVLSNTVLVVSIHSTEGKLLVCFEAQFAEFMVVESSVVSVVMLDGDAWLPVFAWCSSSSGNRQSPCWRTRR